MAEVEGEKAWNIGDAVARMVRGSGTLLKTSDQELRRRF